MNLEQLMELRSSIHASVRGLEDLKAKQALSTNQVKALEKYQEQVAELDEQIAEARAADSIATERRSAVIASLGGNQTISPFAGGEFRAQFAGADGSRVDGGAPAQGPVEFRSFGVADDLRTATAVNTREANLAAVVRGMATGDWSHVPAEQRTLISSGAAAAIPGASVLEIVEKAMQQSVVFKAGARIVAIDRPTEKVARVISTGTPEWKPEAVDRELTDQTITIEPADLTAYSAWLFTECGIETLEDATGLEEAITNAFAQQLASLYDQAALAGTGTDMPLGIGAMTFADDGINELTNTGLLADHTPFIRAAGTVFAKHHTPSSVMIGSGAWTELAMLADTTGQPIQPPKAYTDLSEHVTDFLPDGNAIVADWSKWLYGTRTNITLEISRTGTGFKRGMVQIRAYVRFGGVPTDPTAFCRVSGIELADEASA
ncbi:MAG: phage major capsid protein [Coriobacteriia bacterium]|nr:phage major capsid protein [Coriobacteriia bacterium]